MALSSARFGLVVVMIIGLTVVLSASIHSTKAATGATLVDAAPTFKSKCASCHGADGSGQTAAGKSLKVRDLRSADVQKQSDAELYAIIGKGKGKMPGYEKTLGDAACKDLVAYVRHLK